MIVITSAFYWEAKTTDEVVAFRSGGTVFPLCTQVTPKNLYSQKDVVPTQSLRAFRDPLHGSSGPVC